MENEEIRYGADGSTKSDGIKHYGLKENGAWIVDENSILIHFTCPRVANIQKDILEELYTSMGDDAKITVEEIK